MNFVSYLVVSRLMDKDKLLGFLLVSTGGHTQLVTLDMLNTVGTQVNYLNAVYDENFKTLVGINGNQLTDYPSINTDYSVTTKNGITVMYTVVDEKTKKPLGVVAFNATGQRANLTFSKLNEFSRKFINCNYIMKVDPDRGLMAFRKDGTEFPVVEMTQPEKVKQSTNTSSVVQEDASQLPKIKVHSFDFVKESDFNKPCQEKLMLCLLNLQALTPYYYTLLQAITRKPAQIGTMGVTEDTLYYDIAFVASQSVAELSFVLIHEMMHIAMQHTVRYVGRLNHDLWNIATDLYINSIICNDFNVQFGMGEVNLGTPQKPLVLKTPPFGIYMETIGETIDLARDTPESIYNRLLKENPNYQSGQSGNKGQPNGGSQKSGNGGQQSGQSQQQQMQQGSNLLQQGMQQVQQGAQQGQQEAGNNSQSQQAQQQIQQGMQQVQQGVQQMQQGMQSGNQQQMQTGMQQAQQGMQQVQQGCQQMQNASGSQQGTGNGSSSFQQMQQGCQNMQAGLQQMQNAAQGGGQGIDGQSTETTQATDLPSDLNEGNGNDGYEPLKEVSVIYNGKKLTGKIMKDICTNDSIKSKEDLQQAVDASRKALQRMNTKVKMIEEELGHELEKNAGAGGDLVQRYIEVGLAASIKWQELLKNLCKSRPKKTFTLAQPNQDYMNMGITIADRRAIGKPTQAGNIKFGVDVSGSVSKKELDKILSEINNIFKHFNMDGELIYWSTMVGNAGQFSNLKDLLKINPVTDGGTDVKCLFDYLARKSKVNGKLEETAPKDIKGIFIFTDGCFSHNYAEYERMFGKKVVWVITSNPITFNPPFGRVISLDVG